MASEIEDDGQSLTESERAESGTADSGAADSEPAMDAAADMDADMDPDMDPDMDGSEVPTQEESQEPNAAADGDTPSDQAEDQSDDPTVAAGPSPREVASRIAAAARSGVPSDAAAEAEAEAADEEPMHPLIQDLLLNPRRWKIWPAVAMLRWLLRNAQRSVRGLIYRSKPSLGFEGSEIQDVAFEEGRIDLVLSAPGLASVGSPLPTSDVDRIISNTRPPGDGALSTWLDGPTDRFMQAVEVAESNNNAALALATGGRIEALRVVAEIAGRSAPLSAWKGGVLSNSLDGSAEGAMGLAPLFVGTISASGLGTLVQAFTGLPVEVKEFTGAEVMVLRPARLDSFIGRILGTTCNVPSAGVDVIVDGREDDNSMRWVRDPGRRASVALLCESYVGMQSPVIRAFLHVNADQITPAAFDFATELGGLAVLGGAEDSMLVPITHEAAA